MKRLSAIVDRQSRHAILFFVAVGAIVLWPLWQGRFYAVGDMRDVTIPLETFFQQEQLAGRLPAWHPDVSWGFPVIASAQIGFFYPVLLIARLLPIWLYLPLILFGHVVALLCGTYFFLRRRVSHHAALFGTLSFGLSAFIWQHLTHLNIFLAVAWLPWQLVVADYIIAKPASRRAWSGLALTLGIPFLIGQLQLPFLQAFFVAVYLFFHLREKFVVRLGRLGVVALLVALLAGAQVVPTLELLSVSSRGSSGDFDVVRANQHSFPLYHLPTLLFTRFFGSDYTYWGKRLEIEYGIFIGTLPLMASGWMLRAALRRRSANRHLFFWIGVGFVAFLLALGSLSPFRLLGIEPSLWFFSAPARWLLFTSFCLSILAAYGFDEALAHRRAFSRFSAIILILLMVVVVVGNIAVAFAPKLLTAAMSVASNHVPDLLAGQGSSYYQEKSASLLASLQQSSVSWRSLFTYLPIAAGTAGWYAWRRRWLWTTVGIAALELGVVAMLTTPTVPWQQIIPPPDIKALLPSNVVQKQSRVISLQADGDTGAYLTNPDSRPDANVREQQRQLLLPLMSAQYGVPGITWPASLDIQAQALVLETLKTGRPETFDVALAAQRTVGAVLVPTTLGELSLPIHGAINGVAAYALPASPRAEITASSSPPAVIYRQITPSHVQLTVDSPCECDLVVRDSWYPGWRAFVDGTAAPIKLTEDIFRAVGLTPGTHTIDMVYQPQRVYLGMVLSGIGLIVCLFLLKPARARVHL